MQIATTVKAAPQAAAKTQQTKSSCAMERPDHETWYVGEDKFDSTKDLLASGVVTEKGVKALYSYQEQSELDRDLWAEGPGRAAKGALWGAVGGVVVGAGAMVVGEVLDIFTLGMLGFEGGGLAAFSAVGAGLGALIGPMDLFETHGNYKEFGVNIRGALVKSHDAEGQEHIKFHPGSSLDESIDLGDFAKAPVHAPHRAHANHGA